MKLTGKCLKGFEKWYVLLIRKERQDYEYLSDEQILRKFYRLLKSQQFGTLQDYADSLGYSIGMLFVRQDGVLKGFNDYYSLFIKQHGDNGVYQKDLFTYQLFKTRQEARNAAIDKLNEIINEQ